MKKLIVAFAVMIIGIQFSCYPIYADSPIANEVKVFIQEYSQLEPTWINAKIHSSEKLYNIDDNQIGYLYRIFQKNTQQGYIIYLYDTGITEARFSGIDRANEINGRVYYITPGGFFSKQQVKEYYDILVYNSQISTDKTGTGSGEDISRIYYDVNDLPYAYDRNVITFTITTSHVPDLSSNVSSYYISMVSKVWIEDVPSYLSASSGISNSCAPTSGAMMIAYYDNELWNNLSTLEGSGTLDFFPLFHEDNPALVNNLIFVMADYFRTCMDMDGDLSETSNCVGSTAEEIAFGLERYLHTHWHLLYTGLKANMSVDYDDYTALIALGNPAIVNLDSTYYGSHSVIGIGFYSAYMSPSGIIIYDNWDHGEVWINLSTVTYYEFIYKY